MFKFQNEQRVFNVGAVSFGGQPGERRTVLVGSLFYPGHSIVEDRLRGEVSNETLEKLLSDHRNAMEETGCPAALMVYAETVESMASYLEKVSELSDLPLFIDSPSPDVRIGGAVKAGEMGLGERVVYNSLNAGTSPDELAKLHDSKIPSAVLLAFNPKDIGVKGKIYLLDNGGGMLGEGLIELARKHGIEKPLIDLAVMSVEQNAGSAVKALIVAKAKWGLPSGCAFHNAVESWPPVLRAKEKDKQLFRYVDVASAVIPIMAGADFVMYGPIEYAKRVSLAAAFADEIVRHSVSDL
jgi:tetrahydromethanopterin S-methyltransferase subunit H